MDHLQRNAELNSPCDAAPEKDSAIPDETGDADTENETQDFLVEELNARPRASYAEVLGASAFSKGPEVPDLETEIQIRRDERGRIAREIHQSTSTLLSVLDLQVLRLKKSFLATNTHVREILVELGDTVSELHDEVWAIGGRHDFDPRNLRRQLEEMAAEFAKRSGCSIATQIEDPPEGVSATIAEALFRVAQEALANVFRHARAVNVRLSMSMQGRLIVLHIADDGQGFKESSRLSPGHGINNMKARLTDLGGTLAIGHLSPGTMIEAKLSLPA